MEMDVMIVDDDAVILFLHKILIEKSSLTKKAIGFKDAIEALDFLFSRSMDRPVLIFLDINMPDINGWEFLERLQDFEGRDKTFVVMVTSSINQSDRDRSKAYPAIIDYREKPLSIMACEEISSKINSLL